MMKRLMWLLVLFVACGAACPEGPAGTQPVLAIDSGGLYPGMDTTYSEGYAPAVTEGTVHIVLPLLPLQPVRDDIIDIDVVWPENAQQAFDVRNYAFQVKAQEPDGEHTVFLVTLDLSLLPDPAAGLWPLRFRAAGWTDDRPFSQEFAVDVQIAEKPQESLPAPDNPVLTVPESPAGNTGGSSPGDGAETPKPTDTPAPDPRLMLTTFTVTPSPVLAGGEFQLYAALQNMDAKQTIRNVRIELEPAGALLYTAGEALSYYYPQIGPGEIVELTADFLSNEVNEPSVQQITVSSTYEGKDAQEYSAADQLLVNLLPTARLEWDPPQIPEVLHAGNTINVHIQTMNYGRSTLYNVAASIAGDGLVPESSLYLGSLESGTAQEGDLYVFIEPLDKSAGSSPEQRYGRTTGVVTLTAETGNGEQIRYESIFETEIEPADIPPAAEATDEETEHSGDNPNSVLVAVLAGTAVVVAAVLLTRRMDRKKYGQHKVR